MRGLGYAAGWRVTRLVPRRVADGVFGAAGSLAATRGGTGVRRLRSNLARVVPEASEAELDELVEAAMRSYARYWHEVFRMPAEDLSVLATKFDAGTVGASNVDAAVSAGNGVVVALPHCGNWDAAGVWLRRTYGSLTTVVERLEPESVFRQFVRFRERLGFEVVPLTGRSTSPDPLTGRSGRREEVTGGSTSPEEVTGGSPPSDEVTGTRPSDVLVDRLSAGRVVVLLADRDLTGSGVPVSFFGAKASLPAGPAWLAATTGAALVPMTTWFTDDGWGARLHPRIRVAHVDEVPSATQRLADVFAGGIAAHPADWHMLQPIWPDAS